ncbi:NADH dehydrogenase [ubiquinone] 1 alpha subcomplex subunit 11-like isoform X1 [Nymphalis io]|uniref:NADH dehydrogenase [ubiquinone] 1 alpha subcomplex subunit 11-like isoform X1 n=2 Tax=Inachis io TaxID=171585 RepID=UPI0021691312|nr:NADH dehydrogenase [ubiquinone] 1 alpha subcomplex subunit 11-like isoform X1 [Nymphalis io]
MSSKILGINFFFKYSKMSCECKDRPKRKYYRYYDTPDGCDVFDKILVTSRYGGIAGLILSTYDVLMYSHAVGLGPIMRRYAYHTVPLVMMGATFASVANGVQLLRGKDDILNYFIGGFACGPILAYYLGSNHAVLLGGLGLGVIGMIKKNAIENNYTLVPQVPGHMGTIRSWKHDYTYLADPRDTAKHTCGTKNPSG